MWVKKPFKEKTKITSKFGMRVHPITKEEKFHNGIDISLPEGCEIAAPMSGQVIVAKEQTKDGKSYGYGKYIVIRSMTEQGTSVLFYLAHLKDYSVKQGDYVSEEQIIAHSGNTGSSTAPHLHFEVRIWNGTEHRPSDPVNSVDFYEEGTK